MRHLWFGASLEELAAEARREFAHAARAYVGEYSPAPDAVDVDGPLVLTGHQPGFWHPGVWLKNFAVDALARELHGWGGNLVIDADLCRGATIRVPAGTLSHPTLQSVPFDCGAPPLPWEDRPLLDGATWDSFGQRATGAIAQLVQNPLLRDWWPSAAASGVPGKALGAALAQCRHRLEQRWGGRTLELPQSRLCQLRAFRQFVCMLLQEAPRFRLAYNAGLDRFRRERKIRNRAQPVPNLAADADWVETPFWIWSRDQPVRRPLWTRRVGVGALVADRPGGDAEVGFTLPLDLRQTSAAAALDRLAEAEAAGVRIRSRALATTLFVRWALADLFFHGIGGAHYDQATDLASQEFFGSPPPSHATLTGTLRLPVAVSPPMDERPTWRRRLRDLEFHVEKHISWGALSAEKRRLAERLAEEKQAWIAAPRSAENGFARHVGIVSANRGLQSFVEGARREAEGALAAASARYRDWELLGSREFAFCLFPESDLQKFLLAS